MHVLYDHQAFTGLPYGGVSRYFVDLMHAFDTWPDVSFELPLRLSNNEYLDQASFSNHQRYRRVARFHNAHRVASVLNRLYSRQRVKSGKFDVFHPTYYHRYFLDSIGKKPFVITFHDATSERFGQQYPELGEGLYETKKILLRRASAVIAISEFTKQDLLRYFAIEPEKIHVVYHGSTLAEQPPLTDASASPMPQPYLLFVGKRGLYKNFDGFFRAVQPVLRQHSDLHLVCAGGGSFSSAEQSLFHSARLDKRVHYAPITDDSLMQLYRHALAFVFPSLNEGFGLPVLEAFSAGCPVVLSNRSSLPEVGGNAALYFDPEDDDSMTSTLERLVSDGSLRADLRRKGFARLPLFTRDRMAQQTLDVYNSLC